jgi:hypothetical protein
MIAPPNLAADKQIAELIARLDAQLVELPHNPAIDCYVIGCHDAPTFATRHKQRPGIILTCPAHDPWRFEQGRTIYPQITRYPYGPETAGQDGPGTTNGQPDDQQAELPNDLALRLLRGLIQLAQDGGNGQDDQHQGGGGTREPRRPVPPTLPTGGRHADDVF